MSTWRNTYKVHPAADVFPMMSDEELDQARRGHQGEWAKCPSLLLLGRIGDICRSPCSDRRQKSTRGNGARRHPTPLSE